MKSVIILLLYIYIICLNNISVTKKVNLTVSCRLQEVEREKEGARPAASSLEKAETSEVKAVYKPPDQRSKVRELSITNNV